MEILYTNVVSTQRSITVTYAGGLSHRFALFGPASGDVYWRLDDFRDDPSGTPQWVASHGRLTVAEVVSRLPASTRTVLDWTRREIELGLTVSDDIFAAMRREDALKVLADELADAERIGELV